MVKKDAISLNVTPINFQISYSKCFLNYLNIMSSDSVDPVAAAAEVEPTLLVCHLKHKSHYQLLNRRMWYDKNL